MKLKMIASFTILLLTACNIQRPGVETNQNPTEALDMPIQQTLTQLSISSPDPVSPTTTEFLIPTVTITPTPDKTDTPLPGVGSISGNIYSYPYGAIPSLSIVALEQSPGTHYWYWITGAGNTYFSMDGYVSTGKYRVVAYDSSGHAGGCAHLAEVKKDEMTTCDISDWSGSYPPKPAGVP